MEQVIVVVGGSFGPLFISSNKIKRQRHRSLLCHHDRPLPTVCTFFPCRRIVMSVKWVFSSFHNLNLIIKTEKVEILCVIFINTGELRICGPLVSTTGNTSHSSAIWCRLITFVFLTEVFTLANQLRLRTPVIRRVSN